MEKKNNMALASMIVGIISIVTACCCCGGMIFGGLAVILALLSRVDPYFTGQAKAGLTTGIIGIVLGVLAGILWIVFLSAGGVN